MSVIAFMTSFLSSCSFAALGFLAVIFCIKLYAKKHCDWIAVDFLSTCQLVAFTAFVTLALFYWLFKGLGVLIAGDC